MIEKQKYILFSLFTVARWPITDGDFLRTSGTWTAVERGRRAVTRAAPPGQAGTTRHGARGPCTPR